MAKDSKTPDDATPKDAPDATESSDSAKSGASAKGKRPSRGAKKEDSAPETTEKATKRTRRGNRPEPVPGMNPTWWAPVMVGLMVAGLLWIVTFYLFTRDTENSRPIPSIGYWNLGIGFAMIMGGFMMTTRWK